MYAIVSGKEAKPPRMARPFIADIWACCVVVVAGFEVVVAESTGAPPVCGFAVRWRRGRGSGPSADVLSLLLSDGSCCVLLLVLVVPY